MPQHPNCNWHKQQIHSVTSEGGELANYSRDPTGTCSEEVIHQRAKCWDNKHALSLSLQLQTEACSAENFAAEMSCDVVRSLVAQSSAIHHRAAGNIRRPSPLIGREFFRSKMNHGAKSGFWKTETRKKKVPAADKQHCGILTDVSGPFWAVGRWTAHITHWFFQFTSYDDVGNELTDLWHSRLIPLYSDGLFSSARTVSLTRSTLQPLRSHIKSDQIQFIWRKHFSH